MKYLLTVLFLFLISAPAFGVGSPCPDLIGIYFDRDANDNCLDIGPSIPFNVYVILTNPTAPSINAYEFGLNVVVDAGMEGSIFRLATAMADGVVTGVDVGTNGPLGGDFIVGLGSPLTAQPALILHSFQYMLLSSMSVDFYLGASSIPSLPGDLPVVQNAVGSVLMQVGLSTGSPQTPVATVNKACVHFATCDISNELAITIGFDGDSDNVAAAMEGATDGFDPALDQLDNDLRLTFPHPEWNNPAGNNYKYDVKGPYDPTMEIKQWTFVTTVEIDQSTGYPRDVVLNFDPDFTTPATFDYKLRDNTTGEVVDLNTTNLYSFYAPTGTTIRTFDLIVGSLYSGPPTLRVDVAASSNGFTDMVIRAATDFGASDGYDSGVDLQKPGPSPAGYVTASFNHPEWPIGPRFQTDIREIFDPFLSNKTWPLVVETDQVGSVTLIFDPSFTATEKYGLFLRDLQTGQIFDLFPSLSYVFNSNGLGVYEFELMMGLTLPPDLDPTSRYLYPGWSMISMPLLPLPGSDTFDDVILNQATGIAIPFEYLGASGYRTLEGTATPATGQGYWLAADSGFTWTMSGNMALDGVEIPLDPGWNLVGYPMWFPGPFEGIHVFYNNAEYDWQTAINMGLVSTGVLTYDNTTGEYFNAIDLQPWNGYWINALQPGVSLWFHWHKFQVLPARLTAQKSGLPIAGFSWETTLTMVDSDRNRKSIVLGVHPEATMGFDPAFDMPQPPSSPNGGSRLAFARPEWDLAAGDYFTRDVMPETKAPLTWNVVISTTNPGKVVLSWDGSDWPEGMDYQIYLPGENRVVVMSMREQHNVHLETDGGNLPIVIRTPNMVTGVEDLPGMNYEVGVHPNPFNPRTTIHFDLPRPGNAEIRIYSVRGELLKILGGENYLPGRQEVIWNGSDRQGRNAPSGSYFARLYVDGTAMGSVTKMSLIR